MSDEQREQGRDASAPTEASRTDQHPVPSFAAAAPHAGAPGAPYGGQPQGIPYPASIYGSGVYNGTGAYNGGQNNGGTQTTGTQTTGTQTTATQTIGAPSPGPHPGHPGGQNDGGHQGPPPPGPATAAFERPPRRRGAMVGIVAAALIAGLVGGGAGFGGAYALLEGSSTPSLTSAPPNSPAAAAAAGTVAGAAATATPSTVDIRVVLPQGVAEGSGVVLTSDGAVLTNNHVVAGGSGQISVTLSDGTEHTAQVVGTSPSYDLAVIKIDGVSGLTPATLGNSSDVQVGQQVVAIGSPQGLTGTVTTGIVSAFDRTVTVQGADGSAVVYNGLQTDTPINPGNSGGPLVNLSGQVVGINSAIATGGGQSNGSIGLGFAIPVDQARRVAQEILDSGTATKPVLGVRGDPTSQSADSSGAQLAVVDPGSPAAQAGLVAGDVVTRVGDTRVEGFADLIARIGAHAPGDTVQLTVVSGGAERTVQVTLGSTPDQAATTSGGEPASPFGNPFGSPFGN